MSHELFYTSAARGLRPGNNGYCTVAATHGLPPLLGQKLEALSDYRPLFDGSAAEASRNPAALSHLRVSVLGKTYSVLSRICPAGVDHTHRGIFFAHHVALEPAELGPAGPAWLLGKHGFLETRWDGQVRELPAGRQPPPGTSVAGVCHAWKKVTGDAGWGGVLADSFLDNPNRPVYLLYPLGLDPLPLLAEALALLPPEQRWRVAFSTVYVSVPQDVVCNWRCLPLEAPDARKARTAPGALVLDLGSTLGPALGGALATAARTGKLPAVLPAAVHASVPSPASPGLLPPLAAPPPGSWMALPRPNLAPPPEEKLKPDPEPPPRRDPAPMYLEPAAPRRGRFLPFTLGLLVGMVLAGAGSAAAWHFTRPEPDKEGSAEKQKHARELQTVKQKYETELETARQQAEERRITLEQAAEDKKRAVEQAKLEARKGRYTADDLKQAREEGRLEALKGQAIAEEINELKAKLTVEKVKHATETRAKEKAQAALQGRDDFLDQLGTGLLVKSRAADSLKKMISDMKKGTRVEDETWNKALQDWLREELDLFFFHIRRPFDKQELEKKLKTMGKIDADYWQTNRSALLYYAEEQLDFLRRQTKNTFFSPAAPYYVQFYTSTKWLYDELESCADTALSAALIKELKKQLADLPRPKK